MNPFSLAHWKFFRHHHSSPRSEGGSSSSKTSEQAGDCECDYN